MGEKENLGEINKEKEKFLKIIENMKKKQNRQIKAIIVFFLFLILAFLISPVIYNNLFNKFTYINLDFQKTKIGNIIFYSAKVPIVEKTTGVDAGKITGEYAINLRTNPKDTKDVEVKIGKNGKDLDELKFVKTDIVYISLNPEMKACEDNSLGLMNLAVFLRNFANLKVKSAVSDRNYSRESKIAYASCKDNHLNTVINIKSGNENKIEKTAGSENCYELTYKNCNIIKVTEKFILLILEGYMGYFIKSDKPENSANSLRINLSRFNKTS